MMHTIPDQSTWGSSCVAYTLARIAIVLEDMGQHDIGNLTYNEAAAFHALEKRVAKLAAKFLTNPEAWRRLRNES